MKTDYKFIYDDFLKYSAKIKLECNMLDVSIGSLLMTPFEVQFFNRFYNENFK